MSHDLDPFAPATLFYAVPVAGAVEPKELVTLSGSDSGRRFVFYENLQIGRSEPDATPVPGMLYVADPSVSSKHCVITQDRDGRCFVRDVSLNGTRIDNHRLVPGAEVEIKVGQVLSVGQGQEFRLEGKIAEGRASPKGGTLPVSTATEVTVLVGDIHQYTALVRETLADLLQPSVNALFQRLGQFVADQDGTVKEYPGDAVLAYWEASGSESCAVRACRAALALERAACRLATDASVWRLPDKPLRMDWALSTGKVMIGSPGGAHPVGLSMIGAAVIKAFRLEKLAGEGTGAILVCKATRALAGDGFQFRELGPMLIPGFVSPEEVFTLVAEGG